MGNEFKIYFGQYLYLVCRGSFCGAVLAYGCLGGTPRQHSTIKQDNKKLLGELGHTLAILRGGFCLLVPKANMQTVVCVLPC